MEAMDPACTGVGPDYTGPFGAGASAEQGHRSPGSTWWCSGLIQNGNSKARSCSGSVSDDGIHHGVCGVCAGGG